MSYSSIPAGFSTTCTGLTPAAGPGMGAAGQQTGDMMEAAMRRQICAVGIMSIGAHEWRWGQDHGWVRGGVLMSQGMRNHCPFLLTKVRWGLSAASASPHSHTLSPVFIGEHLSE